ncbi:MAG: HAMP domain-containing sensor histidine kinase [Archaeoglobaceae archaeon]
MSSEEFLKVLISSIADLIVTVDRDGRIIYASPQALRVVGIEASKLLGENVWKIPTLKDPGRMEEFFIKLRLGKFSKRGEIAEIQRENETTYLQIYATPLSDLSGFVLVFRDVTPLVDAYRKIEELNEVLRLMNKILRHDVLNKLAIARGYLEISLETLEKEKTEKALKAIDNAVEIIGRTRDLERSLVESEVKAVDLRKVVEEVSENVRKLGVDVEIEGDAIVFADNAIYSVVDNVMSNAVKHGEATRINVKIEKEGEFCKLTIADNGKGLPMQFADKLFTEGFSYGKSAGSGLGLYIVKRVVQRYGGSVKAYNKGGAVFEIFLRTPKTPTQRNNKPGPGFEPG